MSASAIAEIEDRLRDLTEALRQVGATDIAEMLQRYARDFTVQTRVRRSVNAIREHLESWRQDPTALPESAKVMLAANRLEDACRDALAAGVIVAATPTLAARSRRKLMVVLLTLLSAGLLMLGAIVVVASGVDFNDLRRERKLEPLRLPRGEESSVELTLLSEALVPGAVSGVEFQPLGGCKQTLPGDMSCGQAPPRLWAQGRLPTYEIKLPDQAYGLLFSITDAHVTDRRLGEARLLLAAADETPEGRYEIRLTGAFLGYTPQRCELLQRLQHACPGPRIGQGEKHAGLKAPVVVVDVVPGDPARRLGEKRRAEAEAEEARRKAEERAKQIAAAVSEIRAVLADTKKLISRHRWEQAREQVDKLGKLFQPLEAIVLTQTDSEALPDDVADVRARFEELRDDMDAFEKRVFERTFSTITAESNRSVPEERLLQRIAKQFAISPHYVDEIYTAHADEVQHRIDERERLRAQQLKAEQDARERRCGPLPQNAWSVIDAYVQQTFAEPHVELALGECMTPRLTERDCWQIRCGFQRKEEVAVERPEVVTRHEATFYLMNDRVVRHDGG